MKLLSIFVAVALGSINSKMDEISKALSWYNRKLDSENSVQEVLWNTKRNYGRALVPQISIALSQGHPEDAKNYMKLAQSLMKGKKTYKRKNLRGKNYIRHSKQYIHNARKRH